MTDETKERLDGISNASKIVSALDSQLRMQILLLLSERDHVVHELVSALEKSQPLISQHLRVQKKVGLVSSTRTGREVVYALAVPEAIELIVDAEAVGKKALHHDDLAELRAQHKRDQAKDNSDDGSPAVGAAAIVGVPEDAAPEVDPGLTPSTPSPKK